MSDFYRKQVLKAFSKSSPCIKSRFCRDKRIRLYCKFCIHCFIRRLFV